jgi:hypothetical protein
MMVVSGLWLHLSGALGASPDGYVEKAPGEGLIVTGRSDLTPDLIEVKCPFSAKDLTVSEAIDKLKGFFLSKKSTVPLYVVKINFDVKTMKSC